MQITIRELINNPKYRRPDGGLTDAAYVAYRAASDAYPDGVIPEDELDHALVTAPEL